MRSPKFSLKRPDIAEVINVSRLKSRWRERVRDAMRNQPVPDPLEYLDFHIGIDAICESIAAEVCSGAYIPQRPIRLLSEKSKGLCRQLAIPSAKDALVLQTLSDALWVELRDKAPSPNSFYAPNDNRFSELIRGHTSEYGPLRPWLAFQQTILGFTKNREFIIVTDITNYYDSVSYDHLRNILAGLSIAKEHSLDLLIYTLSHMLWQPDYMPRVQIGLPQINLDAPRLLAHCFLFEIDDFLKRCPNVDFARYMDDIDIGVDSIAEARRILRDLDLSLQTRQIRLNYGKTQILSKKEAEAHFRIRENSFLSRLERSIDTKIEHGRAIRREQNFLSNAIHKGLLRHAFTNGNGQKILKRCINYCRKYRAIIEFEDLYHVLLEWPSCRGEALQWWQQSERPEESLAELCRFITRAEVVDDHALIAVADAVVSARLPADRRTAQYVGEISRFLDQKTEWELYAKVWILSKYGSPDELMRVVESSISVWVAEEHLSRLIGGIFPRMLGSRHVGKFKALLGKSGSRWCQGVLDFHISLNTSEAKFRAVRKFLEAPNPSQPNRITHSKFLMLCSVLKNSDLPAQTRLALRARHAFALADPYYARILGPPSGRVRRVA
jgi:hypothetical protein